MRITRLIPILMMVLLVLPVTAAELRVIVHSSFSLPKPLLTEFEKQSGVKLLIIKGGSAGEIVNKLILTRTRPIADVVYGIDNVLVGKAAKAGVIEPYSLSADVRYDLTSGAASTDYGYITLNIDQSWFARNKIPLPKTLDELVSPAYRNLLVMPNAAASSVGQGFLLATIQGMGETKAWVWWARLRDNGLKVTKGWSEAYYTDFSRNGGSRPIVVSYASSPAAEVYYSKSKLTQSPTANLNLPGGVFLQIEGAALIKNGSNSQAARQFIAFLRSPKIQQALQTSMWMYPVDKSIALNPVFRFAKQPQNVAVSDSKILTDRAQGWNKRWVQIVLKQGS